MQRRKNPMDLHPLVKFDVVIDGNQSGRVNEWNDTPLSVSSRWDSGSDQEKFEVLAAIRSIYNPNEKMNIRGSERQTPSQIARSEGFTELRYSREKGSATSTVIVKPLMKYQRVAPALPA